MFKVILKFLKFVEARLQAIEDARLVEQAQHDVQIAALKVKQEAAAVEQAAAAKIKGVLAALRD